MSSTSQEPALADALAARALSRAVSGSATAGLALGVLALVFLVLAHGAAGPTSIPQLLVLGAGWLAGFGTAAALVPRLRATRSAPGSGPGHAAGAARVMSRVVIGVPVLGGLLALGCVLLLEPRSVSGFSAALALALLVQFALVLHVLRRGLVRASLVR